MYKRDTQLLEVLDNAFDGVFILDHHMNFLYANEAFASMLGFTQDELVDQNIMQVIADSDIMQQCNSTIDEKGVCCNQETWFYTKSRDKIRVIKNVRALKNELGLIDRIYVYIRDMSPVDRLNTKLQESNRTLQNYTQNLEQIIATRKREIESTEAFYHKILNAIEDVVWHYDPDLRHLLFISPSCQRLFGYSSEALLADQKLWIELIVPEDRSIFTNALQVIGLNSSETIHYRIRTKDHEIKWVSNQLILSEDKSSLFGVNRDITEQKQYEMIIEHMAYHDSLTSLPNRTYLDRFLNSTLLKCIDGTSELAVIFIDINDFKLINDAMGHQLGDDLLCEVGDFLKTVIQGKGIAARFGGDEFILAVTAEPIRQTVHDLLESIKLRMRRQWVIRKLDFYLKVSVGVAFYPEDGEEALALIKNSDMAMYSAKEYNHPQNFIYYSKKLDETVQRKALVKKELYGALKRDELRIVYQPQINYAARSIDGLEALLRWHNPMLGNVAPDRFIPIAEQSEIILEIGEWVLKENARWCKKFREEEGIADLCMSVNLSARQFLEPYMVERIRHNLSCFESKTLTLGLEITETSLLENRTYAHEVITKLRNLGVKLSLDDFGTGYSSLSYLKEFIFDHIKIDRSFVRDLEVSEEGRAISEAILSMAKALKFNVIAEGVEKSRQVEILHGMGCTHFQGFYFAKPMPPEEVGGFIRRFGAP